MASDASTIAANERVSIIPNASAITVLRALPAPAAPRENPQKLLAGATLEPADRVLGGGPGDVDVAVLAGEVDPPQRAEGDDLQHLDVRRLLGLVGGERGVGRRLHLE